MIQLLKFLYRAWMKFAHFIGKINTAILLTLFYWVCLAIAKLVTVLLRKDLLDTRGRDRSSYWRKRENRAMDRNAFLKPY